MSDFLSLTKVYYYDVRIYCKQMLDLNLMENVLLSYYTG